MVNEHGDLIAEVCHIQAAEPGGQRYNRDQTDEQRRGFDSLLILCPTHHKVTDNVAEYPVERLREMKREHEAAVRPLPADEPRAARFCEQAARRLQPINLPFSSLGALFEGRDELLGRLRESLCGTGDPRCGAVSRRAHLATRDPRAAAGQ